ncbi:DUF924 family protein [Bartonella tamiae]|uniref:DUF924 domain-containing protein n=1 Tax=Bartonella tamiae Th239 TaxID=1094558 RepID=J0QT90_9HYPH|nr:DUF924 family protein [Bartonella tamiae]EJF89101.1 hypothetical protein ME5_01652 [Bartonella tamiae Th239]EJF95496.1 hypothetical protein MEG_00229 [Bartonella tamiae Th307]
MDEITLKPRDVLDFWLAAGRDQWFAKNEAFDQTITQRFKKLWQKALAGRLNHWSDDDEGLMALILILDQFPRNMFRDDARAFCSDKQAKKFTEKALNISLDKRVDPSLRGFIYLPLEHSEHIDDQTRSLELFQKLGNDSMLSYAQLHYDIIAKFGRFPHRNKALGRITTPQEQDFLDNGGFKG